MEIGLLDYWLVVLLFSCTFFCFIQWLKKRLCKLSPVTQNQPFLSLIVVTRNDEKIVEGIIRRLVKLNYFKKDGSFNYELVVVDDGSTDQTFDILERLTRIYPLLKISRRTPGESPLERATYLAAGERICLLDRYSFLETNLIGSIVARLWGDKEKVIDLRKSKKKKLASKYGVLY